MQEQQFARPITSSCSLYHQDFRLVVLINMPVFWTSPGTNYIHYHYCSQWLSLPICRTAAKNPGLDRYPSDLKLDLEVNQESYICIILIHAAVDLRPGYYSYTLHWFLVKCDCEHTLGALICPQTMQTPTTSHHCAYLITRQDMDLIACTPVEHFSL